MPLVKTKCSYCGKEKEIERWKDKLSKNHFCDNTCKSKFQLKENKIICEDDICKMFIKDQVVLFDKTSLDKVEKYKWKLRFDKTINGYYIQAHERNVFHKDRKMVRLHRLLTDCPSNMQVDHVNRDTLDNRMCNLRICTALENSLNKGFYKNNKSGYKYIWFNKRLGKYIVEIKINSKAKVIGRHQNIDEAVKIRDKFLKEVMLTCRVQ